MGLKLAGHVHTNRKFRSLSIQPLQAVLDLQKAASRIPSRSSPLRAFQLRLSQQSNQADFTIQYPTLLIHSAQQPHKPVAAQRHHVKLLHAGQRRPPLRRRRRRGRRAEPPVLSLELLAGGLGRRDAAAGRVWIRGGQRGQRWWRLRRSGCAQRLLIGGLWRRGRRLGSHGRARRPAYRLACGLFHRGIRRRAAAAGGAGRQLWSHSIQGRFKTEDDGEPKAREPLTDSSFN